MSNATRIRELLSAVDSFNSVHDAWSNDDNAKYPTLHYWRALEQMIDAFETGDLPGECRSLAGAVYNLGRERALFDLTGELDPGMKFWAAREQLRDEADKMRSPAGKRFLESIKELHRQNVPHEQIARMWGLVNPDGSGKSALVQQELEHPGSVITPDYVHPDDLEEVRKTAATRREFLQLAAQVGTHQKVVQDSEKEPPCHETSEELWLQGVSLPQAARMLQRPQADVAAEWANFKRAKDSKQAESVEPDSNNPTLPQTTEAEVVLPVGTPVVEEERLEEIEPIEPAEGVEAEAAASEESSDSDQFSDMSDEELRQQAQDFGIKIGARTNRATLIKKILAAEQNGVNDDGEVVEDSTLEASNGKG